MNCPREKPLKMETSALCKVIAESLVLTSTGHGFISAPSLTKQSCSIHFALTTLLLLNITFDSVARNCLT